MTSIKIPYLGSFSTLDIHQGGEMCALGFLHCHLNISDMLSLSLSLYLPKQISLNKIIILFKGTIKTIFGTMVVIAIITQVCKDLLAFTMPVWLLD